MRHLILGLVFVGGCVVGFGVSEMMQSAHDAGVSSKMKRSMGEALALSAAIERYRNQNGNLPEPLGDPKRLETALVPRYLADFPTDMYNGRPFVVAMNEGKPAIISLGRGGFIVEGQSIVRTLGYRPGDPTK